MSESATVEARQLSKVYWDGDRRLEILRQVSLTVRKGEGVAILGPSGSGKTTLLNILCGLDTPTDGSASLCGREIGRMAERERAQLRNAKLGIVFQFYHLLPEFTALENVMLPALMRRGRARPAAAERAASLLDRLGLGDRATHHPSELSGGEQQRVAIARALMNDPEVLFCDEPTGNLDPETGRGIAELIRDLFAKEKKTVLMVTHDRQLAQMASRVWNIVKGDWE